MQIFTSYKVKIIRSEKEFSKTAKVYQSALHYLLDVVAHEWPMLKNVKGEPEKGVSTSQMRMRVLVVVDSSFACLASEKGVFIMDKKLNEEFKKIFEEMEENDNDWFIKPLSEKDKEKVLLEILKQHPELAKNAIHDLFGHSGFLTTAPNTKVLTEEDYRVCSDCGERLTEWYYYYGDYYCSDCRKNRWSDKEWLREYEEAGGDDNDVIFWSSTF